MGIKILHVPAAFFTVAIVACGSANYARSVHHWSPDGVALISAEVQDPAPSEGTEGNAEPA